ncbi:MAG: glycoside hydrolase family 130 protein [Chloroflexi bacterium]|nr:glycoside hydrolase family 130 protein [Chloroflexota bacterium]
MSLFQRHPLNPLITPARVKPSRPDYEIIGTFNAGATQVDGATILLLRVAERPLDQDLDWITCPHLGEDGDLTLLRVRRGDPDYDARDPRFVRHLPSGGVYLTSISHIRCARSADGVRFTVDDPPWLQAATPYEAFGVEDARITLIDGTYFVNYSAVSVHGIATALAATQDFGTVTRRGIIFPPSNRDVVLFPEWINGQYVCYHRPMPGDFGGYSIWMATSPDLVRWGDHRLVLTGSSTGWDSGRVGGGAPPIHTEHGWLSIYHAADRHNRYCLGAFLTAHDDPARVIARSAMPAFAPEAPYETGGFFPNVVFTCGVTVVDDTLRLYYGASDESVALAEAPLSSLLGLLIAT